MPKQDTLRTCFDCGSALIFVSSETKMIEGSLFPQTDTIYRCSNEKCQAEKDKQEAKRIKLVQEKAASDKKRYELKLALKIAAAKDKE